MHRLADSNCHKLVWTLLAIHLVGILAHHRLYLILQRAPHYSLFGTPDAEEWKSFRKTLNPAFSPDNIRKVQSTRPAHNASCTLKHGSAATWPLQALRGLLLHRYNDT